MRKKQVKRVELDKEVIIKYGEIPLKVGLEKFAEKIYPSILEFYEDEKNKKDFEEWLKKRNDFKQHI